ncbi:MAG: prepilin-type N-terminal cleavage/methylation domain-containing protein [Thermodesulfobacteriota bacterium]|nr:prepilin-type N-terminal cleavage/methylation domain-containing protein [Thermodesulfobacteriota bacterium]
MHVIKEESVKSEAGFTLIEIILALILAGILALMAGMGIVEGVEGYLMSRENVTLTQTSQLALERLRREIMLLNSVAVASPTALTFSNSLGTKRTIGLDGNTVKIAEGSTALTSGDILVGRVDSFSLAYCKDDGSTWVQGTDTLQSFAEVQISITLSHALMDAEGIPFSTTVNPRNNGILNAPIE